MPSKHDHTCVNMKGTITEGTLWLPIYACATDLNSVKLFQHDDFPTYTERCQERRNCAVGAVKGHAVQHRALVVQVPGVGDNLGLGIELGVRQAQALRVAFI